MTWKHFEKIQLCHAIYGPKHQGMSTLLYNLIDGALQAAMQGKHMINMVQLVAVKMVEADISKTLFISWQVIMYSF